MRPLVSAKNALLCLMENRFKLIEYSYYCNSNIIYILICVYVCMEWKHFSIHWLRVLCSRRMVSNIFVWPWTLRRVGRLSLYKGRTRGNCFAVEISDWATLPLELPNADTHKNGKLLKHFRTQISHSFELAFLCIIIRKK